MPEDTKRRNRRIADWQRGKRVAVLLRDKAAVQAAAERAGQSLNAYINEAVDTRLERDAQL